MTARPEDEERGVLAAIRLLLKVDGCATPARIKQVSPELSHRHIAKTVAANLALLKRDKRARIVGVVFQDFTDRQKAGDLVYLPTEAVNYGVKEFDALLFEGADDLAEKHKRAYWTGGLGDCYQSHAVEDSTALRAELAARGYVEWTAALGRADRFWRESGEFAARPAPDSDGGGE